MMIVVDVFWWEERENLEYGEGKRMWRRISRLERKKPTEEEKILFATTAVYSSHRPHPQIKQWIGYILLTIVDF